MNTTHTQSITNASSSANTGGCCTPANAGQGSCGTGSRAANSPVFRPHVDIVETQGEFQLRLDVPGATPDGLEIQYERGQLNIRAKVQPRKVDGRLVGAEYDVGDYVRSIALGDGVDVDRIEATLQLGVLTVRLPKSASLQPRKIQVQAA